MKKNIPYIVLNFVIGVAALCSYFFYTSGVSLTDIGEYFGENKLALAAAFIALYSIRIFIFLPSTVIIIALGAITGDVLFTFLVSFLGVGIGLTQTYLLGSFLGSSVSESRHHKKVQEYSQRVKKKGFMYILVGCFFPVFPTDVICYAAGFIKYYFIKFLFAGMLGEAVLIFAYSYLGQQAEEYILPLSIIGGFIIIMYGVIYLYKKFKK